MLVNALWRPAEYYITQESLKTTLPSRRYIWKLQRADSEVVARQKELFTCDCIPVSNWSGIPRLYSSQHIYPTRLYSSLLGSWMFLMRLHSSLLVNDINSRQQMYYDTTVHAHVWHVSIAGYDHCLEVVSLMTANIRYIALSHGSCTTVWGFASNLSTDSITDAR